MTHKQTLTQYATSYIKERILDCEYKPGTEIFEKELMEDLDMGRTPVREALLQLQSENYVTINPRKNIIINPITEKDLAELYQLRKMIEPQIISLYKLNYDTTTLLNYIESFRQLATNTDPKMFYQLDIDFHNYLISGSKNDILIEFYKQLMELQYRIGMYSALVNTSNFPKQTAKEHEEIVHSILRGEEATIHTTIAQHINSSMMAALQSLRVKKEDSK